MRVGQLASLTNRHGKPTGGFFGAVRSIHGALETNKIRQCFIVFDSGISERRRKLYPPYKGSRYREKDDPFYKPMDAETREFLAKFRLQRAMLQYVLPKLGLRVVRLKNGPSGRWEADDLIFALKSLVNSHRVYIISDDKDMFQCAIEYPYHDEDGQGIGFVRIIRPIARQIVTERNFESLIGYPLSEDLIRKSILGDSSDDIDGITNVGKKTVEDMFVEGAPVCPYPFYDLFAWCSDHRSKRVREVATCMDIVIMNYELVCLTFEDVSLAKQELQQIIDAPIEQDWKCARDFFTELDMLSISRDFQNWMVPFQRLR